MAKSLHTPEHELLCRRLTEAREHAGLTQAEVARRMSKPQSFVSKYEIGERRIDVVEFLQICGALEISAERFIRQLKTDK